MLLHGNPSGSPASSPWAARSSEHRWYPEIHPYECLRSPGQAAAQTKLPAWYLQRRAQVQRIPNPCKSTPITTPINGKKHIIYRIFSLSQSALGTGILENMANAIKKLFQIFFIMTQFPPAFLFLPAEWSRPLPPPHPPVLPVHSSSLPDIADNV